MIGSLETWRDAEAPSIDLIEVLAAQAFAALPQAFRDACGDVVFLVAEFPTDEMLDALDIEDEYDLMGLYEGVHIGLSNGPGPLLDTNRVHLFRRPILDYWAETEDTLGEIVTHVLVHEIGHHLGLSDDDMEAIEAAAVVR